MHQRRLVQLMLPLLQVFLLPLPLPLLPARAPRGQQRLTLASWWRLLARALWLQASLRQLPPGQCLLRTATGSATQGSPWLLSLQPLWLPSSPATTP